MANDHDHGGVNSPQGQQIQYTEEELHLLRQLRREGAMTRGYPAAALTSGLTYFWMRKLPNVSRSLKVVTTIIAGSLAHTAGMLSFYPTAKNRLMEQLPQDSQLRQMFQDLDAIKNDPNHRINSHITSAPHIENPAQFQPSDSASEYQEPERDYKEPPRDYPAYQAPSDAAAAEEEKKPFSSYEELRRRNRSPHSSPYSPPVSAPEPPPPQQYTDYEDNSEQPPTPMPEVRAPRKRYNKYGDEILD